jgi:hypothetical protein
MKVDNELYFAPGIRFLDMDWDDENSLIDAFFQRVIGYYLSPARKLIDAAEAFGAGVLCVTTIDFMSGIEEDSTGNVGKRYQRWLVNRIMEFSDPNPDDKTQTLARRFYDEFRNGLVHEGRIKNAGQFAIENGNIIEFEKSSMIVNPYYLQQEIDQALHQYVSELYENNLLAQKFRYTLINRFSEDMKHVNAD